VVGWKEVTGRQAEGDDGGFVHGVTGLIINTHDFGYFDGVSYTRPAGIVAERAIQHDVPARFRGLTQQ
jgi:hypothetical protein